jgi:hypothetical protein
VSNQSVIPRRTFARLLRIVALSILVALLFVIGLIQIEQHLLRWRAERLLNDIRSLEIHRSTFSDLQDLKRKWKSLANFEDNCSEASCTLDISSAGFYLRHFGFFVSINALRSFMLAGGRPGRIWARIPLENSLVSGKSFHVVVDVPADKAAGGSWPAYGLEANAYSVSEFSDIGYVPNPAHPGYLVVKRRGCDGPCRDVDLIFTPSADPATINRLMQVDPSCLTRWIHPCRTEGDIMPVAWAQYEMDYPRTAK